MRKSSHKILLSLLLLIAISYTIYVFNKTFALFESNIEVITSAETGKWIIYINGSNITLLDSKFIVDSIHVSDNDKVIDGKMAPSTEGYFDLRIDPTVTDVSVRYDISFDFSKITNELINVNNIVETNGNNLVKTSRDTYTGIITLSDIKNKKTNNIRVNIEWENDEENNENDSIMGLNPNKDIEIPIIITVTQYLGEEIKEFEG